MSQVKLLNRNNRFVKKIDFLNKQRKIPLFIRTENHDIQYAELAARRIIRRSVQEKFVQNNNIDPDKVERINVLPNPSLDVQFKDGMLTMSLPYALKLR